ncbi:MAG: hypothetical protein AB8G17_13550 [Gammaproteobacteria bacterium]
MKLRIFENTLRLRLKQSEVEKIGRGQGIVECMPFPGMNFTYRLDVADIEQASGLFHNGTMTVVLPQSIARSWADSDQVSIVTVLTLSDNERLSLLIEKDFKCLSPGQHRSGAEDSDTFAHPNEREGGC